MGVGAGRGLGTHLERQLALELGVRDLTVHGSVLGAMGRYYEAGDAFDEALDS